MTRTRPQGQTDNLAFRVRVKVVIPRKGLGALSDELHVWPKCEQAGAYAVHSAPIIGRRATAIHVQSVADAIRLTEAFPNLTLADAKGSLAYSSPGRCCFLRRNFVNTIDRNYIRQSSNNDQ